jgi:hypothetical protein
MWQERERHQSDDTAPTEIISRDRDAAARRRWHRIVTGTDAPDLTLGMCGGRLRTVVA